MLKIILIALNPDSNRRGSDGRANVKNILKMAKSKKPDFITVSKTDFLILKSYIVFI